MNKLLNINSAWEELGTVSNIYRLIQDGENVGKIQSMNGYADSVQFILIAMDRKRILFPLPFDPNNIDPVCMSDDCIMPTGGTQKMTCSFCSECPNSEWDNTGTKSIPPRCMEVYTTYCWDIENSCPFLFHFKRSSISAIKNLKKLISAHSGKYGKEEELVNFCLRFKLSVSKNSYGSKSYYVPEISFLGESDERDKKFLYDSQKSIMPLLLGMNAHIDTDSGKHLLSSGDEKIVPPASVTAKMEPVQPVQAAPKAKPVQEAKSFSPKLPDITQQGWWASNVGFGKGANMSWLDLMNNIAMSDGKPGKQYLHQLAAWEAHPDLQKVAKEALAIAHQWEKENFGEAPF